MRGCGRNGTITPSAPITSGSASSSAVKGSTPGGSLAANLALLEQNAALALDLADHAYLIETGRLVMEGPAQQLRDDENIRKAYLGY